MGNIQLEVREDAIGFHELFFGLAGETDDDIRRDGAIGDAVADLFHKIAKLLLCVSALHILEDSVISGLNGQLNVRHDARQFGNRFDQIVVEVIGV
jgi:hypothetical protein